MKTLILNGSPKENGDTDALITKLTKHLNGEIKTVSCSNDINPCSDCRHCWDNQGCSINDEMQEIYRYLETCDNIVLASPIWFSSLSGLLLNMASRVQTLWAGRYFRKENEQSKPKNGVIIIVGAQKGTEVVPTQTALTIMRYMNVCREEVLKIYSLNTNEIPAAEDEIALCECEKAANKLNSICDS